MVNKMRLKKVMLTALVLGGISALLLGCAANSAATSGGQVATVQRGNLRTDVTGVGNLALSDKVDLAFEMDGTVQEVLVAEGKSVQEGQLLARLDTTAWEDYIAQLEDNATTAERNVTSKERAVKSAESQVTSRKRDLLQAQINLNNAQLNLEKTEEQSTDILEIQIQQLQVELAQGKLQDAQQALDDAAGQGIDDAKQALADAQKALDKANQTLTDAKNASPEVKAPFSGFITKVNVAGGDDVKKGTVAVTIADPTKFEAQIMVSEVNILKVKLDGDATVQVEAAQGVSLPAKITYVAPSGTIQSGVVNYQVKVELTSLQPLTTQQPATAATGNVTAGAPSRRSGQTFGSANLTQEQINQMRQQRQRAQAGQGFGSANLTQSGQAPATASGDLKLAEGMTVTVSIITAAKNSVLMVPTQAVISQGGGTLVQVLNNGATEERPVQTGISNWQYTEIASGLSEGEQVIVPQNTAPTSTTSQQSQSQQRQSQQGVVPGIQRMLR